MRERPSLNFITTDELVDELSARFPKAFVAIGMRTRTDDLRQCQWWHRGDIDTCLSAMTRMAYLLNIKLDEESEEMEDD